MAIFGTFDSKLSASCPLVPPNTQPHPSELSKTCSFVFPEPKIGGLVSDPVPKHTLSGVGRGVKLRIIQLNILDRGWGALKCAGQHLPLLGPQLCLNWGLRIGVSAHSFLHSLIALICQDSRDELHNRKYR